MTVPGTTESSHKAATVAPVVVVNEYWSGLGVAFPTRSVADTSPVYTEHVTYEKMKQQLLEEVKRTFKPEFLNRIDEVIVFQPLTREHLMKIVELELGYVKERLREQDIVIEADQSAKDFLVEKGFDPVYGARPLKRVIQRFVEDPLAEEVIATADSNRSRNP